MNNYFKQEFTIKKVIILGILNQYNRFKGFSRKLFTKYVIHRYNDCLIKDLIQKR